MTVLDAIGLVGVAAYVAGHFSVQVLHQSPTGRRVMWLNIVGPICILLSMIEAFNLASFLSQCFWLGLTVVGALRRSQRGASRPPQADSRPDVGDGSG